MSQTDVPDFRLRFAIERIQFVRAYTLPLLSDLEADQWFRQPAPGVGHIAWQVGHMAIAQHHLALVNVRGEKPHDARLIPASYRVLFGRGTTAESDSGKYPKPEELRAVLDHLHQQIPLELAETLADELDQPPTRPHPAFQTKFGALVFCAEHEMVHAGQIGLLRRLLGYAPIR